MTTINVTVRRGGRTIEQVDRPVHVTDKGPAVRYRRRLWAVVNNSIDLDAPNIGEVGVPDATASGPLADGSDSSVPLADHSDPAQQQVIRLPASVRVLVDAGPGTGKTHTACQRIAHLIESGIEPGRIWVISFTRTAIAEFRDRIARALADENAAASVQIRTLDAHAWTIQSGFSPNAKLTGSYDDNIREAAARIRDDEDAADFLARLEHLVIDEAQDILGNRADWCLALIDRLEPECGITVFADEAQSIYDFTVDAGAVDRRESLPAAIRARGFEAAALSSVHRTTCPRLKTIFTTVRQKVLAGGGHVERRCRMIREEIARLAHTNVGPLNKLNLAAMPENSLILLRQRADVLERSSWGAQVPHRLRMSGLPSRLQPWIGALLWDHVGRHLGRTAFDHLWTTRVTDLAAVGAPTADRAWQLLFEAAGDETGEILIRRLREVLGRASPPALFCSPEFGDQGPILGTVHASKGREADLVRLYLPPVEPGTDLDEETRVTFVGATRARTELLIGDASASRAGSIKSGRVWRYARAKIKVEVGRPGDLRAAGLVGKACFATSEDALRAQMALLASAWRTDLCARQRHEFEWNYELIASDQSRLGVLSKQFTEDMREVSRECVRFPPAKFFPHLRSMGLRTLVLPPDDPELQLLHEPWQISGFLFAPMLTGFSPGKFG